ncbi:hypothetical protein FPOAC2_00324 [Fusarium poae]|uniref:hypothetical protein n=1 Tax=Fusarium poae TaxID=36050 RepID=UPI001CE76E94|nr:hypothetical protein FPOAC1_000280 [Fusarium poae]KAG8674315.1 hypothetical protein FPOAC1_000280 [Fusarium poae]
MGSLSTDAIVTIISTIPGLLLSSLSAWFAYAAIRRRHVGSNDIETSTVGPVLIRMDTASLTASSIALQLPPVPAVQSQFENANSPGVFRRPPSQKLEHILQQCRDVSSI